MGFTKPIEQILLSYQGTNNVSKNIIRGGRFMNLILLFVAVVIVAVCLWN